MYNLLIVLLDSTIYSNKCACLVAIEHKHKENMTIEIGYVKTLSKMMNPNNNKLFYSAKMKESITIVAHPRSFIEDQLRKRCCTNHAGGNSKHSRVQRLSCNVKDS